MTGNRDRDEQDRRARERFDAEGGSQAHAATPRQGIAGNKDVLRGKWKQMRGAAKTWWGRLTDDDLDQVAGEREKLIGFLQQRYGYARDEARAEVDRRLQEFEARRAP